MKLSYRIAIPLFASIIAFSISFIYPSMRRITLPWYLPMERRWVISSDPSPLTTLAMDWYGRLGIAVLVSLLVAALIIAAWRRLPQDEQKARFPVLVAAGNAFIFLLFSLMTYVWILARRGIPPTPPLPFEQEATVQPEAQAKETLPAR